VLRKILIAATVGAAAIAPATTASANSAARATTQKYVFAAQAGMAELVIKSGTLKGTVTVKKGLTASTKYDVTVSAPSADGVQRMVLCSFVSTSKGAGKCKMTKPTPLVAGSGLPNNVSVWLDAAYPDGAPVLSAAPYHK